MNFKLEKADIRVFDSVFNDMAEQFPTTEMKDYKTFCKLLYSENYELLTAKESDITVGYALVALDKENMVLWLDYIAVLKDFHSKGYGSKVLKNLKELYEDYKGCYLEVEKPDKNDFNTLRRIKFYENLGALKLNVDYFYPNSEGMLAMDLYFIPYSDFLPDKDFTGSVIKNIFSFLHADIKHLPLVLAKIKDN